MNKAYFLNEGKLFFSDQIRSVKSCNKKEKIKDFITDAESSASQGHHVLGFLSYEASLAFDEKHQIIQNNKLPMAMAMTFDSIEELDHIPEAKEVLNKVSIKPLINKAEYCDSIEKALDYIKNGDTYQINYTFRCELELKNSPEQFFLHLIKNHPVPYASYIETDDYQIISLSPELFLSRRANTLTTKPMKGTSKRSGRWKQDEKRRQDLSKCPKGKAENIMIVDLMRNDLSRICQTVTTKDLFEVTRYPSLHQMTGTVQGKLSPDLSLFNILDATYPPGSITGAPKIRAMEIIKDLESSPRGIYTGSIFHLNPNGDFDFNVCIRTIECHQNQTLLGIGSGIVADSGSGPEWDECLLKSSFLNFPPPPSEVFTTLLWSRDNSFNYLERHLIRLEQSCQWLLRDFDKKQCQRELNELEQKLINSSSQFSKVRIAINFDGLHTINHHDIQNPVWKDLSIGIYKGDKINSKDPYIYHKTDRREIYTKAYQYAQDNNYDEVILLNKKGHVCEGSISTLMIMDQEGQKIVPKLKSGLLPSIIRQVLLDSGEAIEKVLTLKDLHQAKNIFMGNSVRNWGQVKKIDY
ncbi:aminodeoxychorismate synthase component I [Lentisphaera profundi]|uniref:Aminodeoxychorismate synthase component I n=1 Tax=Lentisphaera profundi TaxID=1658616 RepID=A0ABY7VU72_9BACT|nr:aminodeoxychorismate synthase component I [Lentisphaera profundi]WDE97456.1 aminodeoxychorismate synthase component I [Lentisphaera profundi]